MVGIGLITIMSFDKYLRSDLKDLVEIFSKSLDDPGGVLRPAGDAEGVRIILAVRRDLQLPAGQSPVNELHLDIVNLGLLQLGPDVGSAGDDVAVGDDHDEVSGSRTLPAPPQQTLWLHLAGSFGLLGELAQDGVHVVPGADFNELQPVLLRGNGEDF